jgi:dipeptidyl aminopeptidase/acylaminoacyl peptidase
VPAPDGSLVFASDRGGFPQPYAAATPLASPQRVLETDDRVLPIADTPHGLLVKFDRGGNETWQLGLVRDGRLRRLTHDDAAIHRDISVAPGARRAGLVYNPGGRSDWVVGVIDLGSGRIEDLLDEGGYWHFLGWSPDGRTAAVAEQSHTLRNRACLLGEDGTRRGLLAGAELVSDVAWAGNRLLALTDHDRDFVGLVEVDQDRPDSVLTRLIDESHDVIAARPDPRGDRVATVVNRGPYDEIRLIEPATGRQLEWERLPPGVLYSDLGLDQASSLTWSQDGSRLYVAWESSTSPAEIYELPSGNRWTSSRGSDATATIESLQPPQQVAYRSFDGLQIRALHFRVDGRPRPTVVWFHGGPESQLRAGFNPVIAMWLAAGFDVMAPNVRGSTGYGRAYFSMDDRERRWDAVRDGVEAGRWLRNQGLATHLIAMGRSYGGYMTLAVLVEDSALWDAGIDIVGIADWHSFFRNTSGWRRSMRTAEYGEPEGSDGAFLREFSPLARASEIRAPLLIIHGRNDVRVPASEAVQIHGAVPGSELIVFEDEGHGITRHSNLATAYGRALEFVRERVRIR